MASHSMFLACVGGGKSARLGGRAKIVNVRHQLLLRLRWQEGAGQLTMHRPDSRSRAVGCMVSYHGMHIQELDFCEVLAHDLDAGRPPVIIIVLSVSCWIELVETSQDPQGGGCEASCGRPGDCREYGPI
jgi:hypothetical protein